MVVKGLEEEDIILSSLLYVWPCSLYVCVCRSIEYLEAVIKVAGFTVIRKEQANGFPENLFPVHMVAIQ